MKAIVVAMMAIVVAMDAMKIMKVVMQAMMAVAMKTCCCCSSRHHGEDECHERGDEGNEGHEGGNEGHEEDHDEGPPNCNPSMWVCYSKDDAALPMTPRGHRITHAVCMITDGMDQAKFKSPHGHRIKRAYSDPFQ